MDAKNPNILFAGTWQVVMHTWAMFSGGPSSGVWVSRDGGTKWSRIEGRGMPASPVGKVDVAIAPTNSNRVYALIQTKDQGLAVAIRRRRRELARRELGSRAHRPSRLLHPSRSFARK
jgi:hypothetical protein